MLLRHFLDVASFFREAEVIAVDIPIGCPEKEPRPADLAAKAYLENRASSVFMTPPKQALVAPSYAEAVSIARRVFGQGISRQAYALRHKILEVETLAASDRRIFEVHPEVSFRALAGRPLRALKKRWYGIAERVRLLEREGLHIPEDLGEVGVQAAPDDVLDSAVAAWSGARLARGEAVPLPDPPEAGPDGRPIAIWY
jgi:predicted RNase H-like nuclease